jgi:hypothetical protein
MPISQIVTNSIANGAIVTADLADGAITTDKIAAGAVVQADLATAVIPLGVGQTWQDMTGSRAIGTTYTNSTGRPIYVLVSVSQNTSGIGINGSIAGLAINTHQDNGSGSTGPFFGIIPNGVTYVISTEPGKTLNSWLELR